jgi:LmbE family N-acetylglucosaminyl deacetylase
MKRNSILVIAAHPDDEILGCGGTIARHCAQGDEVSVIIAAEGITSRSLSRDYKKDAVALQKLQEVCRHANKLIGVSRLEFLIEWTLWIF